MEIVGYCRVSTENQKNEGTIEIQEKALKDYAIENHYNLIKVFCDNGLSGGLENRPSLCDLFDYLESNPQVTGILIYKLDRLARDLYIQEHLIKKIEQSGRKLISIKEPHLESTDPMRKAFRQFMGIVSELEKSFITMRLSGGRINKARKGKYAGGGISLGYESKNKELIVDAIGAETIKKVFYLKRYKKMSMNKISTYLNDNGYKTYHNKKWYAGTVKYILGNPIYKGTLSYKEELTKRPDLILI